MSAIVTGLQTAFMLAERTIEDKGLLGRIRVIVISTTSSCCYARIRVSLHLSRDLKRPFLAKQLALYPNYYRRWDEILFGSVRNSLVVSLPISCLFLLYCDISRCFMQDGLRVSFARCLSPSALC